MEPENCPKSCKHVTFHYCSDVGTHCDKHCICHCWACVQERQSATPIKSGGKILSGDIVV